MKTIDISIKIGFCQQEELSELISTSFKGLWRQQVIVILLIAAFVLELRCLLANGEEVIGANQENAAFPSGLCA